MVQLLMPGRTIGPAQIFMLFYAVALVADVDDIITKPPGWILVALGVWVALQPTRASFFTLLASSTLYFIIDELPDTENHTNLLVLSNIGMMLCLLYSYTRPQRGDDAVFFEIAQPIARLTVIATLFVAGFHKFNRGFINPDVSCVRQFSSNIAKVAVGDFAGIGIPPIFFLGLMVLVVALMLWHQRPNLRWPTMDWAGIATPFVAILAGMVLLSTLVVGLPSYDLYTLLLFFVAVAVLCWQLIEAPLLLVPRFQWVALCFSLIVHVQLALLRIVDFQAIAIALLITFVPAEVWRGWNRQAFASIGPVRMHRARWYFLLNLAGALIMLAQGFGLIDWPRPLTAWGLLFIAGLLVMLWPIISDLFSQDRTWRWEGVPVINKVTPIWLYAMPVCLLLFGMTSHFGLRTAGNFSMYSNLRTEAGQNNHLLLGGDQLKWGSYQEDVVRIIKIGDSAQIGSPVRKRLEGYELPVVEFRKYLLRWQKRGDIVPMTIEYKGVVTDYADIAESPDWQVDGKDWTMRLMHFRQIQTDGAPNRCRW